MSLNQTPVAMRTHIAFFGIRNAGKSLLVNKFTAQNVSVVSDYLGTTTDPVKKTMELLPLGPVVVIDTAGIDDGGELGIERVKKTYEVLSKTDIAVHVIDATRGKSQKDFELQQIFKDKNIPYIEVYNKSDLVKDKDDDKFYICAKNGENIDGLFDRILKLNLQEAKKDHFIILDKLKKSDSVVLVIPIDEEAPVGRIILPQQNTLRELLDGHIVVTCLQPSELQGFLKTNTPKLVITDSQVFGKVKDIVPENIFLTSFSILFARYKGNLEKLTKGAKLLKSLKAGDKVLISEGCTHRRQCNDIGTKKLPKWIEDFSGVKLNFDFTKGGEFPLDTSQYALVVHCGGCMLNEKEMQERLSRCENVVNYGIAISYMNGILDRALEIFKE